MANIKKLCLGSTELVDFTILALKTETVTPATLTSTLSAYATTQSVATALTPYAQQSWVTQQIAATHHLKYKPVATLPATGEEDTIYLVAKVGDATISIPYMYSNGVWVKLQENMVSLAGYATETWVTGQLASYVKSTVLTSTLAAYAKTADVTTSIAKAKGEAIAAAEDTATDLANTAKAGAITAAKTAADNTYLKFSAPMTQAAYTALSPKDDKTLYPIT